MNILVISYFIVFNHNKTNKHIQRIQKNESGKVAILQMPSSFFKFRRQAKQQYYCHRCC